MGKLLELAIGSDGADGETAFFFGLPFGVAGKTTRSIQAALAADRSLSLANEEEQIDAFWGTEDWGAFGYRWTSGYEEHYDADAVVAYFCVSR